MRKESKNKLRDFQSDDFPKLELETKSSDLINGVAASYYGDANVGNVLHPCKYENGEDFPDWMLRLTLKAIYHSFKNISFDLLIFVPPTISGNLVKNFAEKIAKTLKVKISYNFKKNRETQSQKVFKSGITKIDNLKEAFVYETREEIHGKTILLFDDIFDSGATLKEIGRYLTKLVTEKVVPLVIAKTVGGDF